MHGTCSHSSAREALKCVSLDCPMQAQDTGGVALAAWYKVQTARMDLYLCLIWSFGVPALLSQSVKGWMGHKSGFSECNWSLLYISCLTIWTKTCLFGVQCSVTLLQKCWEKWVPAAALSILIDRFLWSGLTYQWHVVGAQWAGERLMGAFLFVECLLWKTLGTFNAVIYIVHQRRSNAFF